MTEEEACFKVIIGEAEQYVAMFKALEKGDKK